MDPIIPSAGGRRLILWMCLFFVCLALGNSLHAAYQVQHGLLLQHSLDTNRAYAEKLAQVTNTFFKSSAQALAAAALDVTESQLDPVAAQKELDQLASVTDTFNAVIAVDVWGKIFAARPGGAFPVDAHLQASQARQLLNAKETTVISGAFKGPDNRWLSIIAHPVFSTDGGYAGFVGGAVHLQGASALRNVLDKLHYLDGSYFYIVDGQGTVVHHPQQSLIGSSFKAMKPVQAVLRGEAGGATDPLTGVANRRGMDAAIEKMMVATQQVAVVMVDVDHFKAVNDKHGHAVGDDVLKTISAIIMAEARIEDVVARMGGEEFVILLPGTALDPARRFAERLRSAIELTYFDNVGNVTISLGVACYPAQGADINDSLVLADTALYRAKAAGRNRVHVA